MNAEQTSILMLIIAFCAVFIGVGIYLVSDWKNILERFEEAINNDRRIKP